ncbi:hypothetical protein H4R18_002333 [Coemansia javaensis]|uniref:Uncharacterized protein n=1 Tax=Coemansia javaensis TaxID=2761396 RepID=A0A9W8LHV9_9FUNG|nr:hypothetical protein H4R18_002333 [Coemansia javaensis]
MRAAAEEWGGARRLSILVHHNGHVPNKGDVDVSDYEDDIEKTSAALAATMPRVHRVLFDRGSVVPVACELFGRLAALYGDRLQVLHSWCPIAVPPGYVFRELRGALIWHGSKGRYRHPCVDPAKLVSLTLSELPLSHSWAPFSADDASEEVEFPSLRVLGVTYSGTATRGGASAETRHSDGHPWRLNFPRLRKLNVLCTQDACPLLEYAVLPGRMEEVTIKAATLVLPRISGMSLPAARRLKIAITSAPDDDNDPAVLAAVGRILKNSPKSKYAWLEVSSSELPVLPEHIAFTPLTALEIWAPTSVDTMLQLIRRLPRLTTLALLSWTLGDIQEDISVPEPGADCLVEPLSTRLATMVLQIDHNAEPLSMFVLAVKYLLLSIPTLARLRSTWIPKEPVMEVVEAYSEQYPHLRSVVLKLGYSRS